MSDASLKCRVLDQTRARQKSSACGSKRSSPSRREVWVRRFDVRPESPGERATSSDAAERAPTATRWRSPCSSEVARLSVGTSSRAYRSGNAPSDLRDLLLLDIPLCFLSTSPMGNRNRFGASRLIVETEFIPQQFRNTSRVLHFENFRMAYGVLLHPQRR